MNQNEIIKICERNPWLASDNEDYDINDYVFNFKETSDMEEVCKFFEHGNTAIRTGIIYDDRLALIQQINAGDEYLAIKEKDGKLVKFESVSMERIYDRRGKQGLSDYIHYNLLGA